jgi:HEPN domain-containing protein
VPVVGLLGACQQPPTREIAAAEAQMEQARQAGADRYAPGQWREAQQALDQARAKVQSGDYRSALSSANEAADKARAAARASAPAKGVVKSSTEMTQAEIRSTLDELASIRQAGISAQVPDEAFGELDQRTEEARDASQRVAEMLEHGDVMDAQKAAAELKARVAPLPEAYREASARWQAEHPRPVRRKR